MKLFRISNLLLLASAVGFAVLLFWTSQAVQKKENELAALQKNLTHEKEAVRVLSVEWDYLNRPQRLEKLAAEQLGMQAPTTKEVVRGVDEIPVPALASTDQDLFEEGIAQSVSLEPAKPAAPPLKKDGVVSPSSAEKQSFDKLI